MHTVVAAAALILVASGGWLGNNFKRQQRAGYWSMIGMQIWLIWAPSVSKLFSLTDEVTRACVQCIHFAFNTHSPLHFFALCYTFSAIIRPKRFDVLVQLLHEFHFCLQFY